MRQGKIGTFSLGIALVGMGCLVALAGAHVVPWSTIADVWPFLIIVFGLELILLNRKRGGRPLAWNGPAFAALCCLFVLSALTAVGSKVNSTFRDSALPWNTRPYLLNVQGQNPVSAKVHNVVIEIVNADVSVTGTTGSSLQYKGKLGIRAGSHAAARRAIASDWRVSRRGDTIDMMLRGTKSSAFSFATSLTRKGDLSVLLPSRLHVTVKTLNGNIRVTNTKAMAICSTLNGSVSLTDIAGGVQVRILNGQISLKNVQKRLDVRTTNGNVTATNVSGFGNLAAVNGSISAALGRIDGNWTLSTVNGDVNCSFLRRSSDAHVFAIGPHIDFRRGPWSRLVRTDRKSTSAVLGRAIHRVNLRTINGSIGVSTR